MKRTILISAVVIFLVGTISQANAQRQRCMDPETMAKQHTGFLKENLDLTNDQVKKIEAIGNDAATKMQSIRRNGEYNRDEMYAAIKKIRDEKHEQIKAILSKDQIAKFDKFKSQYRGMRAKQIGDFAMRGPDRMGNCNPELIEKRMEFDQKLSNEEKAVIADFRERLSEIMDDLIEQRMEQRADCEGKPDGKMRAEMEKEFEPLLAIAENHKSELEDIAKYQLEKRRENRNIGNCTGRGGQGFGKGNGRNGRGQGMGRGQGQGRGRGNGMRNRDDRGHMFAVHFLLLDAENTSDNSQLTNRTMEVMPNPSNSNNTLKYEVVTSGKVKIEILDKEGFIVKTILDATKEAGTYSLNVNVSDLDKNLYFYKITDNAGTQSVKFIVAR